MNKLCANALLDVYSIMELILFGCQVFDEPSSVPVVQSWSWFVDFAVGGGSGMVRARYELTNVVFTCFYN